MPLRNNLIKGVVWTGIILVGLWVIASSEVGDIPSGALLAFSAMLGWWLVGGVNKESRRNL